MFSIYQAARGGVLALGALSLCSGALADCTPEWAENVGLPAPYVPWVWDFVAYNDGSGETLYAAGFLDAGAAIDARTLAMRWDGEAETWVPMELQGVGNNGASRMLAVYNDQLVAGGDYTIDGVSYRVVRWDSGANNWVPMSGPITSPSTLTPDVMVAFDGTLYLGGRHNALQGVGSANLSRFDGSTWGSVDNVPFDFFFGFARDLHVHDGALYASSAFGSVYRLEQNGGVWEQVGGTVPNDTRMATFAGELYIIGMSNPSEVYRLESGSWMPIPISMPDWFEVSAMIGATDGSGEGLFVAGSVAGPDADTGFVMKWDGMEWTMLADALAFDDPSENASVIALYGWSSADGPGVYAGGRFDRVFAAGETILSSGVARIGCDAPPVDPTLSTVVTAESAISSFGGTTRITVTPRNGDGDLLNAGQDVVISVDAGMLLGSVSDQGDGTYRQYLQGDLSAGTQVRATVNGVELDDAPFVSFVSVDSSLSTIALSVDQTFIGGTALVTVSLVDDQGVSVGSGFNVQITTTVGQLLGSVADHGNGTYSQTIAANETGTASVTATVNGMALNTSVALSVLDPLNIGSIIGFNSSGNPVGYLSIQAAINAAPPGSTVFIAPGTYHETILLCNKNGLIIEGLSALAPVTIRGVVVSNSSNLSLRYLTINPACAFLPWNAVEIRGGPRASSGVEILGSTIMNARQTGVAIDRGNTNVRIIDSVITNNWRYGVEFGRDGEGVIINSEITDNGWTGVDIDRNVVIRLEANVITGNGRFFFCPNPNGYGIARARHGAHGAPHQVTLIQNTLANNNGRVQHNRSDSNIGNYDQIIDATDDQSPYTD